MLARETELTKFDNHRVHSIEIYKEKRDLISKESHLYSSLPKRKQQNGCVVYQLLVSFVPRQRFLKQRLHDKIVGSFFRIATCLCLIGSLYGLWISSRSQIHHPCLHNRQRRLFECLNTLNKPTTEGKHCNKCWNWSEWNC